MKPPIYLSLLLLLLIQASFAQPASKIYAARYDDMNRLLYSCNLDGAGMLAIPMSIRPKCIAIDWRSSPQKLYVGLVPISGNGKIIRCDIDGTNPEDVITDAVGVNDIELDLDHRKIYWIQDTYDDDKLFHADMDGLNSNITSIYETTTPARVLWGLALDVLNNRLWITERGGTCYGSYIRRMSLSGSGITTIMNPVCNPHDIEYFNGRIFWGDLDGLEQANPDGSALDTVMSGADVDGLAIDGTNNRIHWIDYSAYSIKRVDFDGTNRIEIIGGFGPLTRVDTDYNPSAVPVTLREELPVKYELFQNCPNPFNPSTTINYSLTSQQHVTLALYDLLGRKVKILVDETKPAGTHEARFTPDNLASGVYMYRLQAGKFVQTRRLMLLK